MATVHEIANAAHQAAPVIGYVVTSPTAPHGDGWWKTLGPAIIAAIVPTAAVVFTFLQSRESTRLAREQAKATNEVARRQVEIAARQAEVTERKLIHDSRGDLYSAWKDFNEAAREVYLATLMRDNEDKDYLSILADANRRFFDASLHMGFLFRDDVMNSVGELKAALKELSAARAGFFVPDHATVTQGRQAAERLSAADKDANAKLEAVREAIRLYTVHGLKREPGAIDG